MSDDYENPHRRGRKPNPFRNMNETILDMERYDDQDKKHHETSNGVSTAKESPDTFVIIGRAASYKDELDTISKHRKNYKTLAIYRLENKVFVDCIFSLEPECLCNQKLLSLNKDAVTVTVQPKEFFSGCEVDIWVPDMNSGASEIGGAIHAAIHLGAKEIILCGCPMNKEDGFTDSITENPTIHDQQEFRYYRGCVARLGEERQKYPSDVVVASMSGFTCSFFGYPIL